MRRVHVVGIGGHELASCRARHRDFQRENSARAAARSALPSSNSGRDDCECGSPGRHPSRSRELRRARICRSDFGCSGFWRKKDRASSVSGANTLFLRKFQYAGNREVLLRNGGKLLRPFIDGQLFHRRSPSRRAPRMIPNATLYRRGLRAAREKSRVGPRVIISVRWLRRIPQSRRCRPVNLLGKSAEELRAFLQSLGEPAYRGAQIYHALYAERRFEFAAMTNLPARRCATGWRARRRLTCHGSSARTGQTTVRCVTFSRSRAQRSRWAQCVRRAQKRHDVVRDEW